MVRRVPPHQAAILRAELNMGPCLGCKPAHESLESSVIGRDCTTFSAATILNEVKVLSAVDLVLLLSYKFITYNFKYWGKRVHLFATAEAYDWESEKKYLNDTNAVNKAMPRPSSA